MPTISKPNGDFTNNVDVADATKVNAQINTLYNAVNGSLDVANVPTLGDVTTLTTTAKNTAVAAINEINANYPISSMSRQALINGNFDVGQRGTSFTIATASSAYTLDRIKSVNLGSGANATVSQVSVSDLDGSLYGLQMVHASAPSGASSLSHVYTIEAKDSYKLAGKKVTISAKVKGVLGINGVTMNARYKTTESAISNSSTAIGSSSTTITNSAWKTITLNVLLPDRATLTTNGVVGVELIATKTTGEVSGDGFIVAQLQMTAGDQILPFQPRNFADELSLCQRYYEVTDRGLFGRGYDTTTIDYIVSFKVKKRVVPSTIMRKAAHAYFALGGAAGTTSGSTILGTNLTPNGGTVSINGYTSTGGAIYTINDIDVIAFDSEL